MAADTVVRARIDQATKDRAAAALEAMGLSISDAIRLLMLRIADEKRLPFDVKVPNAESVRAMQQLEAGKGRRAADIKAEQRPRIDEERQVRGCDPRAADRGESPRRTDLNGIHTGAGWRQPWPPGAPRLMS